jgi:hypothetical protein
MLRDKLTQTVGGFRYPRFKIIKLAKFFQNNRKITFFANFSNILLSKNHVSKKVGRGKDGNLFSIWYFLILHALGYLKPVTVYLYIIFGSTSPSAWCELQTLPLKASKIHEGCRRFQGNLKWHLVWKSYCYELYNLNRHQWTIFGNDTDWNVQNPDLVQI